MFIIFYDGLLIITYSQRQQYYNQHSTPADQRILITTIQEAIAIYFTAHNEAKDLEFDGGGFVRQFREIDFSEDKLYNLLQKAGENIQDALKYMNYQIYNEMSFFGDLKTEWDVRFHQNFLKNLTTFSDQDIDVFFFYLSMISRGILFLHKQIGNNPKHQNWGVDPSMAYCVVFCEAFDQTRHIISTINPERVPICYPE